MPRSGIDRETKSVKSPDRFSIDAHAAVRFDGDRQGAGILAEIAQQDGGAPVHETLRQGGVERIGQLFLQRAGAFGHFGRIGEPVGAMGDIGPGARGGDTARERVDIALHRIEPGDRLREPVAGDVAIAFGQEAPDPRDGAAMMFGAEFLEIGQAARGPEPFDLPLATRAVDDEGIVGQPLEHGQVDGLRRGAQFGAVGAFLQIGDEMVEPVGAWRAVAPEKLVHRREAMRLNRFDFFGGEGGVAIFAAQRSERAILVMPPGAPGNLRHFADREAAGAATVELAQRGEGDMGDIEVQPHADRVGGDEIIDLAIEEHLHLGIAGAGGQRAHHHGGTAPEPPQHFGDGIDFFGREGDDGGAFGQARELLRARIGEGGETRAADDLDILDQRLDGAGDAGGTQDHGFLAPARAEQPVGEDMAAFGVRAQLRFVERDEGIIAGDRHGFGGAEEIAGVGRDDLFLAGDQRDLRRAFDRDHPVIDFAGEQAEGEAHHAAAVPAHPLDREMGLAGIGWPQDGGDGRSGKGNHDGPLSSMGGDGARRFAGSLPWCIPIGSVARVVAGIGRCPAS